MTKYEKETVINFNDEEKIAKISTSQDWMKRKIKKLSEKHSDEVKIISEDQWTLIAVMPKKYVKLSPPRFVSEKQKEEAAERLKKYWDKKNAE